MYSTDQVDYQLLPALAMTGTGDKGGFTPGYVPHIIRACTIVVSIAETTTTTVVNFTTQLTAYSNTGIAAGDIAVLRLLTSYAIGSVVYKDQLSKVIKPGQRAVVNVGTAGATATGDVHIFAEPSNETPLNNSLLIATT